MRIDRRAFLAAVVAAPVAPQARAKPQGRINIPPVHSSQIVDAKVSKRNYVVTGVDLAAGMVTFECLAPKSEIRLKYPRKFTMDGRQVKVTR